MHRLAMSLINLNVEKNKMHPAQPRFAWLGGVHNNKWWQRGTRPVWLWKNMLEACIYNWFHAYLWGKVVGLKLCSCKLCDISYHLSSVQCTVLLYFYDLWNIFPYTFDSALCKQLYLSRALESVLLMLLLYRRGAALHVKVLLQRISMTRPL